MAWFTLVNENKDKNVNTMYCQILTEWYQTVLACDLLYIHSVNVWGEIFYFLFYFLFFSFFPYPLVMSQLLRCIYWSQLGITGIILLIVYLVIIAPPWADTRSVCICINNECHIESFNILVTSAILWFTFDASMICWFCTFT